jgi:hypothetical protein
MTVVHEPSLKFLQFCPHLATDLGPLFSNRPFLLGVFAVRGPGRCKPRQAILRLWVLYTPAPMQGAAPIVQGSWNCSKNS